MSDYPLLNCHKGEGCQLAVYEQILLSMTGKQQAEYLEAVKAGAVVKGQMRQWFKKLGKQRFRYLFNGIEGFGFHK